MVNNFKKLKHNQITYLKHRWRWNVQTGECLFSDPWCESLGYRPDEIIHNVETWKKLVHPDDYKLVLDRLEPHLKGKTSVYSCRNRLKMKNGSYRWNLDAGRVTQRASDGTPILMEGYDIPIAC
tara:strand:+ start:521 stop:892 length:372 start_codon:yes stop_codon:yes gene_type:complete